MYPRGKVGRLVGGKWISRWVGGWVIIFNATMHRKELLRHPRSTAHRRILLRTCHEPQRFAGYSLRLPAHHRASLEIPKGFPGSTAHRRRFPETSHDPQRIAGDSLNQISHGPQRFAGNPPKTSQDSQRIAGGSLRLLTTHNASLETPQGFPRSTARRWGLPRSLKLPKTQNCEPPGGTEPQMEQQAR